MKSVVLIRSRAINPAIYKIGNTLQQNGHDVTIITTDFKFNKDYAKSIENKRVTIIPFHCVTNIGSFLISPSIKKWFKENIKDFDIVHMHNFRSYQNSVVKVIQCIYV
jgi:sporulation protein YlmC with PRC-barrel domain